jgi:hypothetical protein
LRVSDTHRQRRVGQISWPPLGNFLSVSGPVSAVHRHKLDAVWLCKVAERQMLRRSFVPPPPIRVLRDLTRYRIDLVGGRTAEQQRVEKLLADALLTELRGGFAVSCG